MERSRNVEDLHHLRLMALLHELVRERDLKGAAEALGLDPRTLSASMDRGALSGLAQVALERWLLAEGDREAAQAREEMQTLAGRVDGVERRVDGLADEMGQAVAEVQRVAEEAGGNDTGARARELQRLERRMDRLESAGRVGAGGSAGHRRRGLGAMPGWATRSGARIPTWLPATLPLTTRRSSATPGPWLTNGAACGKATPTGAGACAGLRPRRSFWNWSWPCWRSTA